jgi:predicted  nucleic acid-binding Zn-ribbon protein
MRAQEREEFMQKSRKVHPFEKRLRLLEEAQEQMKQKVDETDGEGLQERVSDLESKLEDVDFKLDDVEVKLEEVSEKVEDLEGELANADSRIDDLESEAL